MKVADLRWSAMALAACGGSLLLVSAALAESGADYDYFSEIATITGSGSEQVRSFPEPDPAPQPAAEMEPPADRPSAAADWLRDSGATDMPQIDIPVSPSDLAARALEDVSDVVDVVGSESMPAASADARAPVAGDIEQLLGSSRPALDKPAYSADKPAYTTDKPADRTAPRFTAPAGGSDIAAVTEAVNHDETGRAGLDDIEALVGSLGGEPAPVARGDVASLVDGLVGEDASREQDPLPDDLAATVAGQDREDGRDSGARSLMEQLFGDRPVAAGTAAARTDSSEKLPRVLVRNSDDLEMAQLVDAVGQESMSGISRNPEPLVDMADSFRSREPAQELTGSLGSREPVREMADNSRSRKPVREMVGNVSSVMDLTPPEGLPPPQKDPQPVVAVGGSVADLIGEPGSIPSADDAIRAILAEQGRVDEQAAPAPVAPRSGAIVDEDPVLVVTAVKPLPRSPIKPQQSEAQTRAQIRRNIQDPPASNKPANTVREVDDAALSSLLGMGSAQAPRSGAVVSAADSAATTAGLSRPGLSRPALSRPSSVDSAEQVIREVVAAVGHSPQPGSIAQPDFTRSRPAAPVRIENPVVPRSGAVVAKQQRDDVLASLTREDVSRRTVTPSRPALAPSRPLVSSPATSRRVPSAKAGIYVFGPTKPGSRLEEVADILIPAENITLEQMMWALYEKNPRAFVRGDISRLKEFYILDVPHPDEIYQVSHEQARANLARLRSDARASR